MHWESAATLAERVRAKQISAREVVDAHLARIDAVEPTVHAFLRQIDHEAQE